MRFDLETGQWEYSPPSLCSLAGAGIQSQSSQGSGSGFNSTVPVNMQNPSFGGMAPYTAQSLYESSNGYANGNGIGGATLSNPYTFTNGQSTSSPSNPLVAPVTGPQQQTLGQIGNILGQTPGNLQSAFGLLQNEMSPGFAQGLATSPATQAAEQSAIAPISQQFNSQTVPGLQGSFTQAGQRVGSASGMGSSAFDNSFAAAQGNEMATEAATTGAIANNAYQTGLNIQANAPGQMGSLTSSELNDMISGLNAQALPQLTQQYGISAGTQLYQQQMQTLMQALGLSVQGEQPVIGYFGNSQQSQQNSGSGVGVNAFGGNPGG
jgi:hypothetical protein